MRYSKNRSMLTDLVQAIVTVTSVVSDGRIIPPALNVAISSAAMVPSSVSESATDNNASGAVQQVTNYYPFGAPYADAAINSDFQPYKYNGKELDKMHVLNTYDYGARQHDPILARWDRIDPLAEKYYNVSPYAYCGNNPINAIDSDGRIIVFAKNVSERFKEKFAQAVRYLNQHSSGEMLKALNEKKEIYYISESTDGHNSFDYKTRTIQWDPRMGLKTNEDQYLSPATLLNHEVDHA